MANKKIILSIFAFLIGVLILSFYKQTPSFTQSLTPIPIPTPTPTPELTVSPCKNPIEIINDSSAKQETVRICGNKIVRGQIKVVDKNEYPDLFEYIFNNVAEPTDQYVTVFAKYNVEYVSIISVHDHSSWFVSAIGIYKKEANSYKEIFKQSYFKEDFGRWVRFDLLDIPGGTDYQPTLSISGDLGNLGCYGCRMNWVDYYDWDKDKGTLVLSNNKHPQQFEELLAEYEEKDKKACTFENPLLTNKVISEIYKSRKDYQKLCDDNSAVPFITPDQAIVFLKAKTTIKQIISGENLSHKDIDNTTL